MTDRRNKELDRLFSDAQPEISAHWESCRACGLEAATRAATDRVDACVAAFFERLKALPAVAPEEAVLAEMKRLYEDLDSINAATGYGLLETDERELLVPLFVAAAVVVGVDPEKHHGEPGGAYRDF